MGGKVEEEEEARERPRCRRRQRDPCNKEIGDTECNDESDGANGSENKNDDGPNHEALSDITIDSFRQGERTAEKPRSVVGLYTRIIIANSKRKALARLASDNRLGGCVKIGWPGVIIVEGSALSCRLFVDKVTSWRWQHLSVRAEERKEIPSGDDLDSNGQLPREFIKLGEDDMSEMAKYCREAGLEHMLFVCLKIFDKKISDNEAKETDAMANHPNAIHTRRFSHGALVQVDHINDRRRYRKSLQNIYKSAGCSFFVRIVPRQRHPLLARQFSSDYAGIEGVYNVLKRWRTNRVDVDARNKPCVERMMTVLMEGGVRGNKRIINQCARK